MIHFQDASVACTTMMCSHWFVVLALITNPCLTFDLLLLDEFVKVVGGIDYSWFRGHGYVQAEEGHGDETLEDHEVCDACKEGK